MAIGSCGGKLEISIAFGREYIANPDLVERIRLNAPLNEQRPEGYYGSSHIGYIDYPFLTKEQESPAIQSRAETVVHEERTTF